MSSKRQTLLDYLTETLFPTITTANGYNFNIGLKERGLKSFDELTNEDYPCLFVASADEDRKDISNGQFKSDMVVNIYGGVKRNTSNDKTQQELDKFIEDITKCLYVDPTQGGKTSYMHIMNVVTDDGDGDEHTDFKMQVKFSYVGTYTAP